MSSISQIEKQRLTDPGRLKVIREESSCSVYMLLLQLVASPTHADKLLTSPVTSTAPRRFPVPYLFCGSLEDVSPALSISGEDTGAGLGAFRMAFSSLFMMALEESGSLVEDFQSAESRSSN